MISLYVESVFEVHNLHDPPSLVGKGEHTLFLRGGRRGFDPANSNA
jgi:hypothetical protein